MCPTKRTQLNRKNVCFLAQRVIKLIGSRYIQQKLSSETDAVSPKDLTLLKNDILSVRYATILNYALPQLHPHHL